MALMFLHGANVCWVICLKILLVRCAVVLSRTEVTEFLFVLLVGCGIGDFHS
jgi:hypothetical protein